VSRSEHGPPVRVRVRRFCADEWREYRALRLAALADAPDAFSSTHADAAARPEDSWRERMAGMTDDWDLALVAEAVTAAAEDAAIDAESEPAGLAWGRIEPKAPETATVYQMWVAPAHRRLGAGRLLLDTVVAWAAERGASEVRLDVTIGNTAAWRMYESAGFRPCDEAEPLRPGSPLVVQPMRRILAGSDGG